MTEQELKEQMEFQQWKAEKQKKEQEAMAQQKKKDDEATGLGCGCFILIICLVVGYFAFQKCGSNQDKPQKENVENVENTETEEDTEESENTEKVKYDKTNSVEITNLNISPAGDDGGVSVYMEIKNTSDKTIKYFIWEGMLINRVGDPVKCAKTGDVIKRGTIMGPLEPGESVENHWTNLWYTRLANNIAISKIQIIYMDGSSIVINNPKDLK